MGDANDRYPGWFQREPDGPHTVATGVNADKTDYVSYCRKDGERWPCAEERQRRSER